MTEAESYKEDVLYFKIHLPADYGLLDYNAILSLYGIRMVSGCVRDKRDGGQDW